jgi:hypothetical protein
MYVRKIFPNIDVEGDAVEQILLGSVRFFKPFFFY